MRSGRPERCSFETDPEQRPAHVNRAVEQQEHRNSGQIRDLQAEVAQLRALLSETRSQRESDGGAALLRTNIDRNTVQSSRDVLLNGSFEDAQSPALYDHDLDASRNIDHVQSGSTTQPTNGKVVAAQLPANASYREPSDPKRRSPRGYYSQHSGFRLFSEVRIAHYLCQNVSFNYAHCFIDPRAFPIHQRDCGRMVQTSWRKFQKAEVREHRSESERPLRAKVIPGESAPSQRGHGCFGFVLSQSSRATSSNSPCPNVRKRICQLLDPGTASLSYNDSAHSGHGLYIC